MSRPLPTCLVPLLLILTAAAPVRADVTSATLTADEQKQLEALDPQLAQECVQLLQRLDGWRKDAEALRKALADAKKGADGLPLAKDETGRVFKIAEALAQRSDTLKKAINYGDTVGKRLKQVKAEIDAARYDPDLNPDLTEKDFRARVEATARARVAQALLTDLKPVLDWIDAVKNPVRFAQDFLENEIKAKYLKTSYTVGDVKFRLTQQDFRKSLFSKDAGLVLFLEYGGGVRLKATGLYFRYRKGQLPEPVFDKARMQVDTAGLAASLAGPVLKALPLSIPDLGPISLKGRPTFGGFDGGKPGGITFRIAVQFSQLGDVGLDQLPSAEGDVTLSADGKAKVTALKVTIPDAVTVPVGPGLALQGGSVEVRPDDKTNTVTLKTLVVTAAGGKESLALDVSASFGFPVTRTGVHFSGRLLGGDKVSLGTVDAWLTREKLKVHLVAPDPASPAARVAPYKIDCTGELSAKGLTAHGTIVALFGAGKADVDLFIGTNGYGSFTLSDDVDLGPVKATCSLQAAFRPGFSQLTIDGGLTLEVRSEYFDVLQAVVKLHAETSPRPFITASATVGPVTLECRVGNFKELYDALKKALQEGRAKVYDYLAQRERAAGKYGAERENALRHSISDLAKKNHLDKVSIDNGGPIDQALGAAADDAKKIGGGLAEARDQLGAMGAKGRENLVNGLSQIDPTNPGGVVGKVFSGGGISFGLRGDAPETIRVGKVYGLTGGFDHAAAAVHAESHAEVHKFLHAVAQRQAVNARLNKLASAVGAVNLHKQQHGRHGEAAELRVRIDRVKAHPDGAHDAVVTFFVQTCSFRHKLDPHGADGKGPATAADGRVGEIRITGLFGKGPPRAVISVPKLAHQGPWDPETLLRDRLTELVERYLPKTEFAGRFEERKLAIHNGSPEPITVWVQVESKAEGGRWSWLPGRGEERPAYRYTVPAGKTLALKRPESSVAIHGLRARLWAESDSGLVWSQHLRTDLLLVDNKDEDGEYRYYSDQMDYFVFTFTAVPRPRAFHERLLVVRNDTAEPLLVSARAHTHDFDGKPTLDATGKAVRVEPGKTLHLRHPGGLALRGDEAQVWAEDAGGNAFRWVKHKDAGVLLTDKDGYRGEAIGTALFVFETAARAGSPKGTTSLAAAEATFPLVADQVKVPAVARESVAAATAALQKTGLRAVPPKGAGPKDLVNKQEPAAGTWRAPGSEVELFASLAMPDKPAKPGPEKPAKPGVTKVPTPAVIEGKLVGTWKSSHAGEHVRFKDNGVLEVGHPPAGGGAPKTWQKGRYSHERGMLSLDGGGLKIEGRLHWVSKDKFTVTTGQGKEFTFEMVPQ